MGFLTLLLLRGYIDVYEQASEEAGNQAGRRASKKASREACKQANEHAKKQQPKKRNRDIIDKSVYSYLVGGRVGMWLRCLRYAT